MIKGGDTDGEGNTDGGRALMGGGDIDQADGP